MSDAASASSVGSICNTQHAPSHLLMLNRMLNFDFCFQELHVLLAAFATLAELMQLVGTVHPQV